MTTYQFTFAFEDEAVTFEAESTSRGKALCCIIDNLEYGFGAEAAYQGRDVQSITFLGAYEDDE